MASVVRSNRAQRGLVAKKKENRDGQVDEGSMSPGDSVANELRRLSTLTDGFLFLFLSINSPL